MTATRRQKLTLWAGIVVFAGMGLYPPWIQEFRTPRNPETLITFRFPIGPTSGSYYWIFGHPPVPTWIRVGFGDFWSDGPPPLSARLDIARLAVQWIVLGVVTAGLLWTFRLDRRRI